MASTLVEQLRSAVADAKAVDASSISMTPQYVSSLVSALEHRDETIQTQSIRHEALRTKIRGILENDTATVPTKLQLLRRALSIPEPR